MSNHLGKFKAMLNCTEDPSRGYSKLERLFHSSFLFIYFFCVIRTCKYTKRTTLEVVVIFPSCFCFLRLPDPIHPIPSTGIRAAFSFKWEARQRSQPTSKHLLNLLSPPPTIKSFTQRSSDPVDAKESPKIPKNLGVFPSQNLRDPLRIEFLIGINRTEIQLIGTIPTWSRDMQPNKGGGGRVESQWILLLPPSPY